MNVISILGLSLLFLGASSAYSVATPIDSEEPQIQVTTNPETGSHVMSCNATGTILRGGSDVYPEGERVTAEKECMKSLDNKCSRFKDPEGPYACAEKCSAAGSEFDDFKCENSKIGGGIYWPLIGRTHYRAFCAVSCTCKCKGQKAPEVAPTSLPDAAAE